MTYATQSSPGVQINEIDLTSFVPSIGAAGGAFVGQFNWGPVKEYITINTIQELVQVFGKPTDSNYEDWFSAHNFLSYAPNLKIVRVVDTTSNAPAENSAIDGTGILVSNKDEYQAIVSAGIYDSETFVARYPGVIGDTLKISVADSNTFKTWFYKDEFDFAPGTSDFAKKLGAANDELHLVIIDEDGKFTGVPGAVLEKYAFLSKAKDAKGLDNEPIFYGNVLNNRSDYVWYFGPIKGSGDLNIESYIDEITLDTAGSGYGRPIVTITAAEGDPGVGGSAKAVVDNLGNITAIQVINPGSGYIEAPIVTITDSGTGAEAKSVLGTGANKGKVVKVLPDATGKNYYTAIVTIQDIGGTGATGGAVTIGTDADAGKIMAIAVGAGGTGYGSANVAITGGGGTGATATATVTNGVVTAINVTAPGSGYTSSPTITITPGGSGATATAVIGAIGSANEGKIVGYTVTAQGSGYGLAKVTVTPGGTGATATASLLADSATETNWAENCANEVGVPRSFYSLNNVADGAYSKGFGGGVDGAEINAADIIAGWNMFENAEEVDVGLLFAGHAGGSAASKIVIRNIIDNILEKRRDCMLFFSPNLNDVLNQQQTEATANVIDFLQDPITGINRSTSFAACDSGWKLQYDIFNDKYRWIPINPDIAGIAAQTETQYDAWWSPAGFNRGKIKNVVSLAYNPNKGARDQLYKANINPVVSFTGEGVLLFGDKTLQVKSSAFSYINVRRLFITLEKSIARAAKYQLFEFNDTFTRGQFKGQVDSYLATVKARRGVYDFLVVCDESNNTPDIIDRAEFVASIFIKPARSINFITLNFVAVRTGVEFSEVVGIV